MDDLDGDLLLELGIDPFGKVDLTHAPHTEGV
jgi:hypothetical protein